MSCRSRCCFLPLAHVEHYFADLLSVMESGRDPETGLTREALRPDCPRHPVDEPPPTDLHLPPNLYVIGTAPSPSSSAR